MYNFRNRKKIPNQRVTFQSMKKIIIFGSSGRVGQKLVEYALADNYLVTAFVRNENKILIKHPNLQIVTGDVFNEKEVTNAIE